MRKFIQRLVKNWKAEVWLNTEEPADIDQFINAHVVGPDETLHLILTSKEGRVMGSTMTNVWKRKTVEIFCKNSGCIKSLSISTAKGRIRYDWDDAVHIDKGATIHIRHIEHPVLG